MICMSFATRQPGTLAPPFGGDGLEAQRGTREGDLAPGSGRQVQAGGQVHVIWARREGQARAEGSR